MPTSDTTARNRAERIREARQAAGLSQEELARACGVTTSAVAQWESLRKDVRTVPSTGHLLKLSQITGRSVDWLSGFAAHPTRRPDPSIPAAMLARLDAYEAVVTEVARRFPQLASEWHHRVALGLIDPIGDGAQPAS